MLSSQAEIQSPAAFRTSNLTETRSAIANLEIMG
jgi:hypothetical protein